jgi:hypothetical protein
LPTVCTIQTEVIRFVKSGEPEHRLYPHLATYAGCHPLLVTGGVSLEGVVALKKAKK